MIDFVWMLDVRGVWDKTILMKQHLLLFLESGPAPKAKLTQHKKHIFDTFNPSTITIFMNSQKSQNISSLGGDFQFPKLADIFSIFIYLVLGMLSEFLPGIFPSPKYAMLLRHRGEC